MEVRNDFNSASLRRTVRPKFGNWVALRKLGQDMYEHSKGVQKGLQYLGTNNGENLNNIVTAVGTSAVAPIFIRYNPLSHEDSKTKAYTAWRQPISAVINLAVQLLVMSKYNDMLDRHATYLATDRMDLRAKPKEAALRKLINAEYKHEKAQAALKGEKFLTKKEFTKQRLQHYQDEAFYSELNRYRKEMANTDIPVADLIKPKEFQDAREAAFKELIKKDYGVTDSELGEMKDLDAFKKKGKSIIKSKRIDTKKLTEDIERRAEEIASEKVLKELEREANIKVETSARLDKMLTQAEEKSKEIYDNPKVKDKSGEILKTKKKIFTDTINTMKKEISDIEKEGDAPAKPEGIDEEEKAAQMAEKRARAEVLTSAVEKMERAGSIERVRRHGSNKKEVLQSVRIKKWLKVRINRAEQILSDYKKKSGIVVGLMILPITCGILNWSYPRIMERFFPELTEAKKASAQKKAEAESTDSVELTGKEAK